MQHGLRNLSRLAIRNLAIVNIQRVGVRKAFIEKELDIQPISDYCVMFAQSEPYCHSILFVCLSVIPRPTAYHD